MKILKFYSKTCGPCKALTNNLNKAGIECINIDVNEDFNETLINKYDIASIPTLVVLDDFRNVISKHKGVITVDELKKIVHEE